MTGILFRITTFPLLLTLPGMQITNLKPVICWASGHFLALARATGLLVVGEERNSVLH
jgi:hypothetical protein